MNITVIGATGATGRQLLARLALRSDVDAVTILARRPAAVPAGPWRVLEGDASDLAAVTDAVTGAQAVVLIVGAPSGTPPALVRSTATRVVADAIRAAAPGAHLVAVSAVGGAASIAQLSWFGRMIYRRVVGDERLAEVTRQEEVIAAASIAATVVRPPKLDDAPATGARVVTQVRASATLHRADLADYLLEAAMRRPAQPETVTLVSA
jgi:uncharacterized protein YbjT (DUF2867 family)